MKKYYIVYNADNFTIENTFGFFCLELNNLLRSNNKLKFINITHPKTKDILNTINIVNKTNY